MQKKTLFHHKITLKWYKILVFTFNQIVCVAVYNEGRVSQHFATRVLYLRLFCDKNAVLQICYANFSVIRAKPKPTEAKITLFEAGWLAGF